MKYHTETDHGLIKTIKANSKKVREQILKAFKQQCSYQDSPDIQAMSIVIECVIIEKQKHYGFHYESLELGTISKDKYGVSYVVATLRPAILPELMNLKLNQTKG